MSGDGSLHISSVQLWRGRRHAGCRTAGICIHRAIDIVPDIHGMLLRWRTGAETRAGQMGKTLESCPYTTCRGQVKQPDKHVAAKPPRKNNLTFYGLSIP